MVLNNPRVETQPLEAMVVEILEEVANPMLRWVKIKNLTSLDEFHKKNELIL